MTDTVGRGLCAGCSGPGIVEGMMQKLKLLHFLNFVFVQSGATLALQGLKTTVLGG